MFLAIFGVSEHDSDVEKANKAQIRALKVKLRVQMPFESQLHAYQLCETLMRTDFASKVRYQRTRNSLILVHSSSSSICDELVQLRPMQAEHMALHSSPAFLHEHLLPHPVLHPHDTMHNIDFDASGLSLYVGINTPSLHCHLQSVGSNERPSHCCTV